MRLINNDPIIQLRYYSNGYILVLPHCSGGVFVYNPGERGGIRYFFDGTYAQKYPWGGWV